MKKTTYLFIMALGFLMAQGVSAATLTWNSAPSEVGNDTVELGSAGSIITGDYTFLSGTNNANHAWSFHLTPAADVQVSFGLFLGSNSFNAKLDGTPINSPATVALGSGNHMLELLNITAVAGTHENITIHASAVPVPGAFLLMGPALLGLLSISLRKSNDLAA